MGNKWVTGFFLLLLFFGCKTVEKVIVSDDVASLSENEFLYCIEENEAQKNIENVFFRRTSVSITSSDNYQSFRCNIFLRTDSFIRISVLAPMGIEVARISLDPEDVIIIDRLNREVIYTGYDELYRKFHVFLNFKFIQDVLLNRASSFFETSGIYLDDYFFSGVEDSMYKLSSMKERRYNRMVGANNLKGLVYHQLWFYPEKFYLKNNRLRFEDQNIGVNILYEDFNREISGFYFPTSIFIEVNFIDDSFSLKTNFGNIKFNEDKGISFSVPDKYVKVYR